MLRVIELMREKWECGRGEGNLGDIATIKITLVRDSIRKGVVVTVVRAM
jgi:hypothetical protein